MYSKILLFLLITGSAFGQIKDIIYYNQDWKETTKEKAAFYRNLPLQEKEGNVFIKDYYISGAIQMTGWAKKDDEKYFDGEITWFYENGNISQIANYKNGDRDGEFKEFLENGNLIEIINFSKGYRNGEAKRFREDGKIATLINYENGKKNGNAIAYNPDGTVISDVIFKDNNPYEGIFIKGDKDLKVEANFKEGLITEIESKHNTTTITKGTFVDGKPNNGTFISKANNFIGWDNYKITTLVHGKEEGKQVYKNLKETKPYAYYYAKNGKKEGESYIYDEEEKTAYVLNYKKGIPFNGELIDRDRNILIYKKGKLNNTKKRITQRGITFFEIYKNDVKTGVEYSLFDIKGETNQVGNYKNNKPYNGYFLREGFDFPVLDYYKKGIKKYQYSNRFIHLGAGFQNLEEPLKSVYKNNIIFSGVEFLSKTDPSKVKIIENGKQK